MSDVIAESSPQNTVLTPELKAAWDKGEQAPAKVEPPKVQDSAPVDAPPTDAAELHPDAESGEKSEEAESAAEAGTATESEEQPKPQLKTHRKLTENERIRQLNAKLKTAEAELAAERERSRQAVTKPPAAEAQPQNYDQWKQGFDATKWMEQWAKDNPQKAYEQGVFALTEHINEVKDGYRAQAEQQKAMAEQIKQAQERYEDTEVVGKIMPTANQLFAADMPKAVQDVLNASPVFIDLLYTLSDSKALNDFVTTAKANPAAAIRKAIVLEQEIMKELAEPAKEEKPEPVKAEVKETPEKPVTKVPPPVREVGGRGTAPEDEALAAVRAGDMRSAKAIWNRQALAKGK